MIDYIEANPDYANPPDPSELLPVQDQLDAPRAVSCSAEPPGQDMKVLGNDNSPHYGWHERDRSRRCQ